MSMAHTSTRHVSPSHAAGWCAAGVYLGVALVGRITGPLPTMFAVAVVCAVLTGVAWASACVTLRGHRPSRHSLALVVAGTFGVPFYAYGADALSHAGLGLTVLLLAAGAIVVAVEAGAFRRS